MLISLLNAIILLIAVGAIVVESIHKLQVPPTAINGAAITWTAAVGILINGATTLMLMKGGKRDLNVKGAYLHMAADTLVSVGVVVSGIIISATGLTIIDPIISLVIAAIILFSTLNLLTTSLRLALDGTPQEIDVEQIERTILNDSRITDVHHIHLWAMSTTENALTAHIVVDNLANWEDIKHDLKHALEEKGVSHSTLEAETATSNCDHHCT